MRGLLIKDFKLMKMQKNFFLTILAIGIGMSMFSEEISFAIGFLTFVMSLFTLSTVSYDEFDNGNAFLFSLPITRRMYVVEKYCLGLVLGCGSWMLSAIMVLAAAALRETASAREVLMTALMILPLMLIVQATALPFQLKFGGEKGRIAIIGSFGLLFVTGTLAVKAAEAMNIDIDAAFDSLPTLSVGMVAAVMIAAAAVLLLISMKASISIMERKEF